jgi:hypothetical protein
MIAFKARYRLMNKQRKFEMGEPFLDAGNTAIGCWQGALKPLLIEMETVGDMLQITQLARVMQADIDQLVFAYGG